MEIHDPIMIGSAIVEREPTDPKNPVRLQDLVAYVAKGKVFISDIVPTTSGIVGLKEYLSSQPADKFLSVAYTDTRAITVHVIAQGSMFVAPNVTVAGVTVENFTSVESDVFSGTVDIVIDETTETIEISNVDLGTTYGVTIHLQEVGPEVSTYTIGALPNSQTEIKENDVVSISGMVENDAVSMSVVNYGAAKSGTITSLGEEDSAGTGYRTFTGTFVTSGRSGDLTVQVNATNALGTSGTNKDSANSVNVSQLAPTIGTVNVVYGTGQDAAKNGETVTITASISDADGVVYSYTGSGNATITDPEVYAVGKEMQIVSIDYEASNNYRIVATRAANGAVTTKNATVLVETTPLTLDITIDGNPTRLASSVAGETYRFRVRDIDDSSFLAAPAVTVSTGTIVEGSGTLSGNVYTFDVTFTDSDVRGDFTVEATAYNKAAVQTVYSETFNLGAIAERSITFPAFAQYAPIGVAVTDITKVRAHYAGTSSDLIFRADTTDVQGAFSIVNESGVYDANGTHLFINDAAYAGANTSGSLQLIFEETA